LSILGASWVLRNDLESELYDGCQPLREALGGVPLRILGAKARNLRDQRFKGIQKLRVRNEIMIPPVSVCH
jgi:hypothetical protein